MKISPEILATIKKYYFDTWDVSHLATLVGISEQGIKDIIDENGFTTDFQEIRNGRCLEYLYKTGKVKNMNESDPETLLILAKELSTQFPVPSWDYKEHMKQANYYINLLGLDKI